MPATAPPTSPPAAATPRPPAFRAHQLCLAGMPDSALELDLPAGGRWLIGGPAGSGKTTLARTVLGLISPASGTVELFGHDLDDVTPDALLALRRRAVLVTASDGLFPAWSGFDNLALPLRHHGLPDQRGHGATDDEVAAALRARAQRYRLPASWLEQPVTERSREQRLVLAFIRALLAPPQLIIVDGIALAPLLAGSGIAADAVLADALAADPAILVLQPPESGGRPAPAGVREPHLPPGFEADRFRRGQLDAGRLQWHSATDRPPRPDHAQATRP